MTKEEKKEKDRIYREKNKEKLSAYYKLYKATRISGMCSQCGKPKEIKGRATCNTCVPQKSKNQRYREWTAKNREKVRQYNRDYYWLRGSRERVAARRENDRAFALAHYSKTLPPACACCNETSYEFLAIDHIHGGGAKHSRQVHQNLVRWLKKNNWPEGFRVLCHNCNMSRGIYGYCPHNPDDKANPQFSNSTRYSRPFAEDSNLAGKEL